MLAHPHRALRVTLRAALFAVGGLALVVALGVGDASAARSRVATCQKAVEENGASLVAKVLLAQQHCLRRRDGGKLPPDARCLVEAGTVGAITDRKTRDALLLATERFRTAVQRRCASIDLFASLPAGLGFPSTCPTVGGSCGMPLQDTDDVLACLACTHFATARQLVDLERPSLSPPPSSTACPTGIAIASNAGNAKVLDVGWTGLGHEAALSAGGTLTFDVHCTAATRPCGVCDLSGPVPNGNAGAGAIDSRRCGDDSATKCTSDDQCPSGGCALYAGAPLPFSAGGLDFCVTNQITGSTTGTVNVETGAFATALDLTTRVHNADPTGHPCPTCVGDGVANDGVAGGTCSGGSKNGAPCDVQGTSPIPSFGATSLDCPPSFFISAVPIALAGSTGTEAVTLSAASPDCTGVIGRGSLKCFCPAAGTQPTQPNSCLDITPGDESLCRDTEPGSNRGSCALRQDRVCAPTETFRSCLANGDCAAPGDTCVIRDRPCYLDNGAIGGSVVAFGHADPPIAGVSNPTFAALFCVPPLSHPAGNAAAGLPGLGRLELPLTMRQLSPPSALP